MTGICSEAANVDHRCGSIPCRAMSSSSAGESFLLPDARDLARGESAEPVFPLRDEAHVRLRIYDLAGRVVRSLSPSHRAAVCSLALCGQAWPANPDGPSREPLASDLRGSP